MSTVLGQIKFYTDLNTLWVLVLTLPLDPFMSHLATQLGYSAGDFQALQLIVPAAFGVVYQPLASCMLVHLLEIDFKPQFGCRFDIMDSISPLFLYFDICNYICQTTSYHFYTPVWKTGRIMPWQCPSVRLSVCPSVRPSVRPSAFSGLFFNMLWDINLKLGIYIQ